MTIISIAIHGLPEEKGNALRKRIFSLIKGRSYAGQVGITVYPRRLGDKVKPSIRLPHLRHFPEKGIIRILKGLGIEVEFS